MLACRTRWQVWGIRMRSWFVKSLWAYAYQIVPPQPSQRLAAIRTLLKDETAAAHGGARTWSGRLVLERDATHILIVSDDIRGRDHPINRQLEAELLRLDAAYSVTEPLAVAGHAEGAEWLVAYGNGNGNGHGH
jgi:hypothetical protein